MATVTDPIILDSTGQDIVTALNNLNTPRDTAAYTTSFASSDTDDASATSWTVVSPIAGGETHATLFGKLSQIAKNVRFLYKTLGNTDLSAIADGTVTGAISGLNYTVYSYYVSASAINGAFGQLFVSNPNITLNISGLSGKKVFATFVPDVLQPSAWTMIQGITDNSVTIALIRGSAATVKGTIYLWVKD